MPLNFVIPTKVGDLQPPDRNEIPAFPGMTIREEKWIEAAQNGRTITMTRMIRSSSAGTSLTMR